MTFCDTVPHASMRRSFKSLVSRHFRRSYLYKVIESEETRKSEYASYFLDMW